MPKYTHDDVRKVMDDPKRVRNVVVVAAKGDGKSTLIDNLGVKTGYLNDTKIGEQLFTLYRADEREKKSNVKANPCHLVHEAEIQDVTGEPGKYQLGEKRTDNFLFTVIDTPGHTEYSPELAASCRMTDGSVLVVGVNDGVSVGLEYSISDSIKERVKPTLFVNKLDISIITLQKTGEEIYQQLDKCIQNVNVALQCAEKQGLKGWTIDAVLGNVIFGSAFYGWAFSLRQFAEVMAAKNNKPVEDFLKRMWGDQFFNPSTKKWAPGDGEGRKRGFSMLIMDPIIALHKACLDEDDTTKGLAMCEKMGIALNADAKKLTGKALLKKAMNTWIPAGEALTRMMATHLPDPVTQQKLKMGQIYKLDEEEGETDIFKAMKNCDKDGPVMAHVVKMMPTGSAGRFYALARVFSGTITTDKYHCRGADFDHDDPETFSASQDGRVQSLVVFLGKEPMPLLNCPAGNIVGCSGIDQVIMKSATVTNNKKAQNFNPLTFNVSAIVRIAIKPADNKHLPKLVEGLKRLCKSDILVTCSSETSGDHIVGGCGEEHLKTVLKDLREEHAGVEFTRGVPTVSYKETCDGTSPKEALSKSPNKHNRLYVIATHIDEGLCRAIETYRVTMQQELKKRARILIDDFDFDKAETQKIWGFGPNDIDVGGANILVDCTKGIQYLNEIKDSVNAGMAWATKAGPLAEENMRGCRFNLMDVKLHADSIHRGLGQISPTARRVMFGSVLTAEPKFMEPIFKCVIACPEDAASGVNQALLGKRGEVQFTEDKDGKTEITAFLPISETLGNDPFSKVLQTKTSGKAFATYEFSHWSMISTNPLEKGSKAESIMLEIRERKGMKVEQPDLSDYIDRL